MTENPASNVPSQNVPSSSNPAQNTALASAMEVPDYLTEFASEGNTGEELSEKYAKGSMPFLKVVQGTGALSMEFDPGTVVRTSDKSIFMRKDDTVIVTPLFIYPQFNLTFDMKANTDSACKQKTLDQNSELAKKCEPWSKAARLIPDPDHPGLFLEYVRAMIHVVYVHDTKEIVNISLQRGEDETFREWQKLRRMRGAAVPIYAGRYAMTVGKHPKTFKSQWSWRGFNFRNATDAEGGPWNNREVMEAFREKVAEIQLMYDSMALLTTKEQDQAMANDQEQEATAAQFG